MLKRTHSNPSLSQEADIHLDLSHRNLSAEDLNDFHQTQSSIDLNKVNSLKLSFNRIQDKGALLLSLFLQSSTSLLSLDISFNNVGDQGIKDLSEGLKANKTLQSLVLSGNRVTSVGFAYLKEALLVNDTLTTLYLSGNSAQPTGFQYIADALRVNKTLRNLSLNGNKGGAEGALAISKSIIHAKHLRGLNLVRNNDRYPARVIKCCFQSDNRISDVGVVGLCEALHHNKSLKSLELSFNFITHASMESLSYALWNYTSMSVLLIDNNKLGDVGAKLLASCLSSMNLTHLNVAFNDIGPEGVTSLLHACLMPINSSSMSILNISGSTLNTDVARLLADLIARNKTLAELYLDRANIGSAGERYIATGIATNRHCGLVSFTGFDLGEVLTTLGSPPAMASMPNKKVLQHLQEMWRAQESKEHEMKESGKLSSSCSTSAEDDDSVFKREDMLLSNTQRTRHKRPLQISPDRMQMFGYAPVGLFNHGGNEVFASHQEPGHRSVNTSSYSPHAAVMLDQVPPAFNKYQHALQEIGYLPFVPADLWSLHQYYFSPSPGDDEADADGSTSESDTESQSSPSARRGGTSERPKKRQSNKRTMARIAGYPRLKVINFPPPFIYILMRDSNYSRR